MPGPHSDNMPNGTRQSDIDDGFGRDEGYGESLPLDGEEGYAENFERHGFGDIPTEPDLIPSASSLAESRVILATMKKRTKEALAKIEEKIACADGLLLKLFKEMGISSVKLKSGENVHLSASLRSKMRDGVTSVQIAETLIERGLLDLLMGSASTIKAFVKEKVEEWERENEQPFNGDWKEIVPGLSDLYEFDQTPSVRVRG